MRRRHNKPSPLSTDGVFMAYENTMTTIDIWVNKTDISQARIMQKTMNKDKLEDGEAMLQANRFSFRRIISVVH